jgi:hypothetical protein
MKKSLSDMISDDKAPQSKDKKFGAFTNVEGNQAQIDLSVMEDKLQINSFCQCLECLRHLCNTV